MRQPARTSLAPLPDHLAGALTNDFEQDMRVPDEGVRKMIVIAILCAALTAAFIASGAMYLRVGIGCEESDHSLRGEPATRAATLTRHIVGLYVLTPQNVAEAGHAAHPAGPGNTASKISGTR